MCKVGPGDLNSVFAVLVKETFILHRHEQARFECKKRQSIPLTNSSNTRTVKRKERTDVWENVQKRSEVFMPNAQIHVILRSE